MRLVGAWVVHWFYRLNFFYDTETAFDKYQAWGFLKQVYFNAVLFNWLCVVVTCTLLFNIVKEHTGNLLFSFGGGLLYLLGFGTIFYAMMPLTEACSILLFTITLQQYLRRSYLVIIPLLLLIFQREYVLLAMGLLTICDLVFYKERYFLFVLMTALLSFGVYYFLRKTVFYTPALDFQSGAGFMWKNLIYPNIDFGQYLKQQLLTLNIFFLYLVLMVYKWWHKLAVDRFAFIKVMLLFLQVNVVSISGGHGNNVGRYFYLLVPMVIFYLIREMSSQRVGG